MLLDAVQGRLCTAVLDAFLAILGAVARNLAPKTLATGGVYVGGGIPPRILPSLANGRFLALFRRKGRFAGLLARVPVRGITSHDVALIGAAGYGLAQLEGELRTLEGTHPDYQGGSGSCKLG